MLPILGIINSISFLLMEDKVLGMEINKVNLKKLGFIHVRFWFMYWLVQSLLWSNGSAISFYLVKNVAIISLQASIVYLNLYVLYPYLFKRRYYLLYILSSVFWVYVVFIISFTCIGFTTGLAAKIIPDFPQIQFGDFIIIYPFWIFLSGSVPYSLALVCSLVWRIYQENEQNKQIAQELAMQKAQTEIQYLRSQISPHFLFNSLNNIHLLILKDGKTAAEYTLLLSDLLRYFLYEVKKTQTTLKNEIQCLSNYLQLMALKIESPESQETYIDIENDQLLIVPLLLIALVENGVKHSGIEYSPDAFLKLSIKGTQSGLEIEMENSIILSDSLDSNSGIGMENLRRRLLLNYPEQHTFFFEKEKHKATTLLTLKLAS